MWEYNHSMYSDELYHYGVKGMKWGVRRYEDKANLYSAKAQTARTAIGTRHNLRKAGEYKNRADIERNVNNAKGIKNRLKARYGEKAYETINTNNASTYAKMRDVSKGARTKARYDAASNNAKYMADYARKAQQKKTLGQKIVKRTLLDKDYRNTPYQKVSGKTTTLGKKAAAAVVVSAAFSVASVALQASND